MCVYEKFEYTLEDGTELEMLIPPYCVEVFQNTWDKWLPNITKRKRHSTYVAYNVSDYMIAK